MTRCPRCGNENQPVTAHAWRTWVCPACRAKLRATALSRWSGTVICAAGVALLALAWLTARDLAMVGQLVTMVGILVVLSLERCRVVAVGPYCSSCGYELGELPEFTECPECGAATN